MHEMITPIHHKIYTLRGKQIMLDSDLAELYQVETKVFNQAVKRNSERFLQDFMFQCTEVSIEIMRTFTKLREFTLHYNALSKQLLELERKNDKKFKEIFKILDTLVFEAKKTDEKVMGFLKP
jgi:hypothetical protein